MKFIFLTFIVIALLFFFLEYTKFFFPKYTGKLNSNIIELRKNIKKSKKNTFHVIVLCTENYDNVGCYGVNLLKKYCDIHGYTFTHYKKFNLKKNIHINFLKNAIIIDALKYTKCKYIVNIDADIGIKDMNQKLEDIINFDNDTVFNAPEDRFYNFIKINKINTGFTIWRNCKRSIEINKLWIKYAMENEKNKSNLFKFIPDNFKLRQQNIFDKYIFNILKNNELKYLDHKKVGMLYSSFIFQTKKPYLNWKKNGEPNYKICNLNHK